MKKTILITGATSGIGHQLAIDYLNVGQNVIAVGRNEQSLSTLKQLGATTICVDLTNHTKVMQQLSHLADLDLAICCAGVCHYIDIVQTAPKKTEQDAEGNSATFNSVKMMEVMHTNFSTLVYTIEAILPALKQAKGRLVTLGSASAFVPFARAEAYGSSKAAVHYLTKTLQISLKPHGVGVSLVIPGFVKTPMTAQNDFDMPFLQTVEQASLAIREGINKEQEVIEFPKSLTLPLKTLGILPDVVWQKVAKKMYDN